jgi:signal transduction histidine kinase/HAMP domain-containing protein
MRLITRILAARISTKIVLPYLLLALLLAAAVALVAARLTAGSLEDRLSNRLIEAGQATSDGLVAVEDRQIEELRTVAFTEGVPEAVAAGDTARLEALLRPIWANAGLRALVIFDASGAPLLSWRRAPGAGPGEQPASQPLSDLEAWWPARQILGGQSDAFGDKFSAFREGSLWTAAPIKADGALIGGAMVATPLDELLPWLQARSQASITSFYDGRGVAVATTQIVAGDAIVPAIPVDALRDLVVARAEPEPGHIQDTAAISGRDYQVAYSPLRVRRAMDGFFSVALPRSFIISTWEEQRTPILALSLALLGAVVAVGTLVARQITVPLAELVTTARAVARGDLQRRSEVRSRDELGLLARAFNQMTGRLLHLYETSRDLGAQHRIDDILAQTARSVERLAPGAVTLVALRELSGWRLASGACDEGLEARLPLGLLPDDPTLAALARRAEGMTVAPADARRLRGLGLPDEFAEICYTSLSAQGQLLGLLVLAHRERGAFPSGALEPLAAIAGMAAAALHNVRLYDEVEREGMRRDAILRGIADAVIVCDARGRVALMNPAAEALLEVRDWQQRRYSFAQLPLVHDVEAAALIHAEGRVERYRSAGRTLSASFATLPGDDGGEVIVLRDISDAAALDRAKTDLIALISHELRTPLTAIRSASDMLCKGIGGTLPPLQRDLAETALRQSQAMGVLIDKAIMVAGIELGTLELDLQPTGLRTVVEVALGPLRGAAASAGVRLSVDIADGLPLVDADARLLSFAVGQLVDNAIKYGGEGTVQIEGRAHGRGVALTVRDRGPGIPPGRLPHLFERLRRDDNALNAEPRGLGLGLTIVRELVDRQGGKISVESQPGEGATFTIFLRVSQAGSGNPALAA